MSIPCNNIMSRSPRAVTLSLCTTISVLCLLSSVIGNTRFMQTPVSQNHFLGSIAIFHCSGYDLNLLNWYINGNEYQLAVSQQETGIKQHYMENTTINIKTAILAVPAQWDNDGSSFYCEALYRKRSSNGYSVDKSMPVLLKVQGPPGKVVNFDGYNISSTTIVLTWNPPFHLPHLKPCCLHYYVNITHLNTSDIIHDDNITSTNVTFSIDPQRLCDVYIATIGGYNQVGLGDIFVQAWSLGGHFNISNAIFSLQYTTAGNLQLHVDVTILGYCLNDLSNVSLTMDCMSGPPIMAVNDINAHSSAIALETTFNVAIPQSYQDRKCLVDLVLENRVDYKRDIVTYDVVNANYTTGPGYICVSCYYLPLSAALGCHVNVTLRGEDEGISHVTNITKHNGTGCVNVTVEGTYLVSIFDWNRDSSLSKNPVFTFNLVSIDAPPLISPSTFPLPNTPTVNTDKLSDGAIGGIVGSGGIFVLIAVGIILVIAIVMCRRRKVKVEGGIDEVDFELTGPCSDDKVNGKDELFERVQEFLESYYNYISKGNENFPLRVQKRQKNNCLHLKVSEKNH